MAQYGYGYGQPVTQQPGYSQYGGRGATVAPMEQYRDSPGNYPKEQGDGWQYGICGCCAEGTKTSNCCLACWCPCIAEYRIALRLGESCLFPFHYVPYAGTCAFFPHVQPEMAMSTRLRALVGIEQSQMTEGCCWLWCGRCMLCRMLSEMDYRQIDMEK